MCALSSLLQQGQEGSAQEEGSNDIGCVEIAPVLEADETVSTVQRQEG